MVKRCNLSFSHATTMDFGFYVPVGCVEALPGDMFTQQLKAFLRIAPLNRPLMHEVNFELETYFVPNRLLWSQWEDFRNGVPIGSVPTITFTGNGPTAAPVADYMGAEVISGQSISALPVRAYNLIINRKKYQRFIDVIPDRNLDDVSLARALWDGDRFTRARRAPQLGSAAAIPLTFNNGQAPVKGIGVLSNAVLGTARNVRETGSTDIVNYPNAWDGQATIIRTSPTSPSVPNITADLSAIAATSGISLSDLRRSIKQQQWQELRNKIGDDYVDWLRAVGVNPDDTRMREPEFIGRAGRKIAFSEVLSTADTGAYDVGEMAGHGIGSLQSKPMRYMAKEDGYFVTIASLRPVPVYANGLPRMFRRLAETDFWSPQREGIGDQPVFNYELRANHAQPQGIFGYEDRHADYTRMAHRVTGELRTGIEFPTWHWARMFATDPALNPSFVLCDPSPRVFADSTTDNAIVQFGFDISALRRLSSEKVL